MCELDNRLGMVSRKWRVVMQCNAVQDGQRDRGSKVINDAYWPVCLCAFACVYMSLCASLCVYKCHVPSYPSGSLTNLRKPG